MILHLAIIGGKVKIRSAIFLNGQYVNAAKIDFYFNTQHILDGKYITADIFTNYILATILIIKLNKS
jgi:hypothetical protein